MVCEVVYVLVGEGYDREQIVSALIHFSRIRCVAVASEGRVLQALIYYRDHNVDFADALMAAIARSQAETIWTFNAKHFKRLDAPWAEPP